MKEKKNFLRKNADFFWHGGKVLLCALQFLILGNTAHSSFVPILQDPEKMKISAFATLTPLFYLAVTVAFFFIIWCYYDEIDDRSFNQVCQDPNLPRLLCNRAYLSGIALTALTAVPILKRPFVFLFEYLGLHGISVTVLSLLSAVLLTVLGSVLRIWRLNAKWAIQKNLPLPKKAPSVFKRIFYAVIFFLSLLIISYFSSICLSFVVSALKIFLLLIIPTLIIVGSIFLWYIIVRPIRLIRARRKFMRRLQKLQENGELSFTVHGHPYLSILTERIAFGLTVIDTPHPNAKTQEKTAYQVTFANCKRKRYMIILRENNIYQFVYALRFNMITRFSRMGAVNAGNQAVPMPGIARLTNHSFEFPEGEGERILLIDPPPIILAIRNESNHNLIEVDNASKVFGYTVYGKNAFVNMLERT